MWEIFFLLSILNQRNATTNFFVSIQKQQPCILESCFQSFDHVTCMRTGSMWRLSCRPLYLLLSPVLLLGARPASGICDIFPSLYISTANLTNFSRARHSRLCGPSALQNDRQLSLNQWINEWCETGSCFHMASHEMTRFCPQAFERVRMVKLSGIQEGLAICLTISFSICLSVLLSDHFE